MNCSNCGAPLSHDPSATSVTCSHCGHTNQIAAPAGASRRASASSDDDDDDRGRSGGGNGIPAIVVVQAPAPQPVVRPQPVIVVRGGGRRYRSSFSLLGLFITIAVSASIYWYTMRIRNSVAASVREAEHAADTKAPEHKKK